MQAAHVRIERLFDFVMSRLDLTEDEQSHLIRCDTCIEWLDACVSQKVDLLLHRPKNEADLADSFSKD